MVSKFAQSSIALFLAKGAFAASRARDDQKVDETPEAEPGAQAHQGARRAISLTPFGEPMCFEQTSCRDVYRNKVNPETGLTSGKMILNYIQNTLSVDDDKFLELQKHILLVKWGGMCWPVDGRGATGGRPFVDKNVFKHYTGRNKQLKVCEASTLAEDEALENLYSETPSAGSIYSETSLGNAKQFFEDLGGIKTSVVYRLNGEKPSWVELWAQSTKADYVVDVGSGKAAALKDKARVTFKRESEDGKQFDLADELYEIVRGKPVLNSRKVVKRSSKPLDFEPQTAEGLLKNYVEELFANFHNWCNTLPEGTEPTVAFGLTGKWRKTLKSKNIDLETKAEIFEMFKTLIEARFSDFCKTVDVLEVTGEDEARFGSQCLFKILQAGDKPWADEHKIKYVVSMEGGNGSSQLAMGVVA